MPAILSKNCVFVGEVESYCLVCCELLPAEHDALAHIQQPSHKHSLTSHHYLHKFRRDCIRKVAGVYFCEFCNVTFPTAAKVSLHVTEATHVERRSGRMLTRGDNCIVFNENVLITEHAWNGLVDDTCVLCNAEFDDESLHKSEQNHILNLIRSKVTVGVNNDIYRQVEGIYQCLTCNKIVTAKAITEHFESTEHKSLLMKVDQNNEDVSNEKKEDDPKIKIIDKEDKEVKMDDDMTEKLSDNAGSSKSLKDIQPLEIDNTNVDDKPEPGQTEAKQQLCSVIIHEDDGDEVRREYGLSFVETANLAFKRAYSTYDPSTFHTVEQHAARNDYRKKLPKRSNGNRKCSRYTVTKMRIQAFITTAQFIRFQPYPNSETKPFVLVENIFFLNVAKFIGLARFRDNIICQFCSKELTPENLEKHINSSKHKDILDKAHVVISVEDEFVRELKPNLFDCTFCGHVERDWGDMLDHLESEEHQRCKDYHEKLLLGYKMSLMKRDLQNSMPFNLFAMLNNMRLL